MDEPLDLVPCPAIALQRTDRTRPRGIMLFGFGASGLIALGLFAAGLPLISLCLFVGLGLAMGVGSITTLLGAVHDRWPRVASERILSPQARSLYGSIRLAYADIENALADAPRLRSSLQTSLERCRSAVDLAGRIALLANPLERYLFAHDAASVRSELERLQACTEASSDDATVGALSRATSARARQLAMQTEITTKREQICARLEAIRAELEAFAATLAKLRAVDEEPVVLVGEPLADQLETLGDDLHTLESVLEDNVLAA